jgi:hypothetical protein
MLGQYEISLHYLINITIYCLKTISKHRLRLLFLFYLKYPVFILFFLNKLIFNFLPIDIYLKNLIKSVILKLKENILFFIYRKFSEISASAYKTKISIKMY